MRNPSKPDHGEGRQQAGGWPNDEERDCQGTPGGGEADRGLAHRPFTPDAPPSPRSSKTQRLPPAPHPRNSFRHLQKQPPAIEGDGTKCLVPHLVLCPPQGRSELGRRRPGRAGGGAGRLRTRRVTVAGQRPGQRRERGGSGQKADTLLGGGRACGEPREGVGRPEEASTGRGLRGRMHMAGGGGAQSGWRGGPGARYLRSGGGCCFREPPLAG